MSGAFSAGLDGLRRADPEAPARLAHQLAAQAVCPREGRLGLAQRMRPADVLCCRGDVPVGAGPGGAPPNGRSIAETIAAIESCGSWAVLKAVDQDPAYRAVLDDLLAEIAPLVRPVTGPMLQREAFIFISSPDAVTPLHFDPEHNILMQIRGRKVMTLFPAGDEALAPGTAHEAYHLEGSYGLHWHDAFEALAQPQPLAPGDALYVPVKAPHWVRNGDEPSVSLSITWRSGWSLREGYAHGFNRILRRAGLTPRPPRRFPAENRAKALAYQCIRKATAISLR